MLDFCLMLRSVFSVLQNNVCNVLQKSEGLKHKVIQICKEVKFSIKESPDIYFWVNYYRFNCNRALPCVFVLCKSPWFKSILPV